jgi:hypothetical protein
MTKKKVKEVEPKVEKPVKLAKLEIYEVEYCTSATMRVLVQAPSKLAADAWADAHGDDYINEELAGGREWDEQDGEFQSVRRLKPVELKGLSVDVVVDADGEPLGGVDDDDADDVDDVDDVDDDSDDADDDT